jgi:N12 class adenine-specific DNA methylase
MINIDEEAKAMKKLADEIEQEMNDAIYNEIIKGTDLERVYGNNGLRFLDD